MKLNLRRPEQPAPYLRRRNVASVGPSEQRSFRTRHPGLREENAKAASLALSKAYLDHIDRVAPAGNTAGPRYGVRMMSLINR